MAEVILHHYPQSPVSEKVRLALGMKRLPWRSVQIPRVPPKPDLMPLTGGHRLTPVMQIGAEVFCDSLCILRTLEARYPEPTLVPGGADGLAWGLSRWTDGPLFKTAIAVVFGDAADSLPAAFAADRGRLYFGPDHDLAAVKAELPESLAQLRAQFDWIEQRLATGREFLLGERPGLPDALCYYLVWFIRGRYSRGAEFLAQFSRLVDWERRVEAIGHGRPEDFEAAEALAVARDSAPDLTTARDPAEPLDLEPGETVAVASEGVTGNPPVTGELLRLDLHEVVLRREDERVGTTAVHFPRVGYRVARA